jgi:hypothetical protein
MVTDALDSGRAGAGVIDRLAALAGQAATQSIHDLVHWQLVAQDRIQVNALVGQQGVQGFGLGHCAGEAIEQESTPTVEAAGSFPNHRHDDMVGDEFPPPHGVQSGFQGRRRLVLTLGTPEEIAGGEMARAQGFVEQLRLCALADSRRTEQDQPVRTVIRRLDRLALGKASALEPRCSIGLQGRSPREGPS